MSQAQETDREVPPEGNRLDEMVAKVRAIARGPHGELFSKVVESFFEQTQPEYFSPEDLQDIEEGVEEVRQGRCLTLEEYRQGKRL